MKKLLLTMLCGIAGVNLLMAAYQYGDYVSLGGGKLTVIKSGDIALYFDNSKMDGVQNPVTSWSQLTVYATDSSGKITTRTVDITGSTVEIGSFNPGETLSFSLSGAPGATAASTSVWGSYEWDSLAGVHEYVYFGGNYGANNSLYSNWGFKVKESEKAPTGQPLPGVLAALVLGGGFLGASRAAKRRKA